MTPSVRIVIPDDEPAVMVPSAAFQKLDGYDVLSFDTRPSSRDELVERIGDAEVVINIRSSCRFDREVFERCRSLRMISIWGTGTDNVDVVAARERRVCLTNTSAVSRYTLGEHALMLILAAGRRIVEVDRRVRDGEWPRAMITELYGKTLGLIGTGAIGAQVGRLGAGIGMNVIAWTFHPTAALEKTIPLRWVEFEDVFAQSEVVSVHVRHTPDTDRFIGRKHFERMKSSALFINTARGGVVDEPALIDALRSGTIGGAGLDVFWDEPLGEESPFFDLPNVVLTPHSGGISLETTEAGLAMTIENVFAFLEGNPVHVVG